GLPARDRRAERAEDDARTPRVGRGGALMPNVAVDLRPLFPALIVAVTGLVVLLVQAFPPNGRSQLTVPLCLVGLAGALAALLLSPLSPAGRSDVGITADAFSVFLQVVILLVGAAVVVLSPAYLRATEGD